MLGGRKIFTPLFLFSIIGTIKYSQFAKISQLITELFL